MSAPHLTRDKPIPGARGLVLMLHGGAEHDLEPVGGRSRAWLRSRAMMWQLHYDLRDHGLDVWLLRYQVRGWNHADGAAHAEYPSPVPDARWALEQAHETFQGLPVVLLGHSMGARTATAVADDPQVAGVVALAPWFPLDEPVTPLTGKRLFAAHGRADSITKYDETAAFVERAKTVAVHAELTDMGDVGHYMLKGMGLWNKFALDSAVEAVRKPSL